MDECVSSSSSLALAVIRLLRHERVFARHVGQDTVCLVVTPYTTDYDQQRILRVLRRVLTKAFYAARLERDTQDTELSTATQDSRDTVPGHSRSLTNDFNVSQDVSHHNNMSYFPTDMK